MFFFKKKFEFWIVFSLYFDNWMVEIIIGFDLVCTIQKNATMSLLKLMIFHIILKEKWNKKWNKKKMDLCTDVCLARALHQQNPGKNAFFCLNKSFVAAMYLRFYESVLLNVHMDVFLTSNAFIRSSFSPFNSMVFFLLFMCKYFK